MIFPATNPLLSAGFPSATFDEGSKDLFLIWALVIRSDPYTSTSHSGGLALNLVSGENCEEGRQNGQSLRKPSRSLDFQTGGHFRPPMWISSGYSGISFSLYVYIYNQMIIYIYIYVYVYIYIYL